ncbi:MAG: hypothetical protein SNG27_01630 [Rikenellaceae bacterium]
MRNFTKILFSLILLAIVVPATNVYSKGEEGDEEKKGKKEKPAKEKKPLVWVMPELTGNPEFDEYLVACDALYNALETYTSSIPYYEVKYYLSTNAETGEAIKNEDGEYEYIAVIEDQNGKVRNAGGVVLQYTEIILTGTNILLDCTNLTVLTASATTALPSLGVAAFSYGKYIKQGPQIANKGLGELKGIVENLKAQSSSIKALKKGSTTEGELAEVMFTVTASDIKEVSGEDFNFDELTAVTSEKMAEVTAAVSDEELKNTSDEDLI